MSKYQKVPMVHLHTHSSFSELDAISKISDLVKRADQFSHGAIGLSDHGTIAGLPEFHKECKIQGVKPLMSCEFYFVPNSKKPAEDMDKEEKKEYRKLQRKRGHVLLIAMNLEGWINLQKLVTRSNEQFYYFPIVGYDDLREFGNGLICVSGCIKSQIKQAILAQDYETAVHHVKEFSGIFGDRYYLEIQDGGLDVQTEINPILRRMGEKFSIPLVATQDAHYIDRNDSEGHEAIWAIRTRQTFDKPTEADIKTVRGRCDGEGCKKTAHRHNHDLGECRFYYSTKEYWLKDAHHILNECLTNEFGEVRRANILQKEVEESAKIADRIGNFEIKDGLHLPKYTFVPPAIEISSEDPQFEYLNQLVKKGYEVVYGKWEDRSQEHRDRLEKEFRDIKDAELADYFLIVWDIINFAREKDIKIGPGRGSAAGSIVSYCLGITKIDPLKYGLIWERFYNVGRKGSLADIDSDFSYSRRGEVVDYISERYGEDRVAQIGTIQTMGAKAALKNAAKVLGNQGGIPYEDANVITRFIPMKHGQAIKLAKAIEECEKIKEYAEKYPRLFRVAQKLEGCPRGRGTHACGVVILDKPFSEGFPLRWNTTEKKLMTEYDMEVLDSLGYMKMDVLGSKTMNVLSDIEEDING